MCAYTWPCICACLFTSLFSAVALQGHAAPILYAAWAEAGFVKEAELLNLRKIDCLLEGHPTPVSMDVLNGVRAACLGVACKILHGMTMAMDVIFVAQSRSGCRSTETTSVLLWPSYKFRSGLSHQKLEFVDVATGSLGQGLGAACGMAYTGKHFDKARYYS